MRLPYIIISVIMLATCTCGKKLFFGEDPGEQQVCDRCGQKVDSPLSATDGQTSTPLPQHVSPKWDKPAKSSSPRSFAASPMSSKLHIASLKQSPWRVIGCLALILLVLIGPVAADFIIYPPRDLMCNHYGKIAYLFGLLPLGHDCEALHVISYMKLAREEVLRREVTDPDTVPAIGELQIRPPASLAYLFEIGIDRAIFGYPSAGELEQPQFILTKDGSLLRAIGEQPTLSSPVVHTFK